MKRRILTAFLSMVLILSLLVFDGVAISAPTEPGHCSVIFYKDADMTKPYSDVSDIDPAEYAYYKIVCEPGYFCKRITVNADYADGEKIRFGTQIPSVPVLDYSLLGDADTDGDINIKDVQNFMQRIANWSFTFSTDYVAGDINGDHTVNMKDCALLIKYIAGWDVELCDGVSDQLEIYSNFITDITVKGTSPEYYIRAQVKNEDPITSPVLYVIESYEGLVEYTSFINDYYMMDDIIDNTENYFLPEEICEKYNEKFFESNDLVVLGYFYDKEENPQIDSRDGNLNIYFTYAGSGVSYGIIALWHCMITVPHESGINLQGDFSVTHRTVGSVVGSGLYLYEYSVREYFGSGFAVQYYK